MSVFSVPTHQELVNSLESEQVLPSNVSAAARVSETAPHLASSIDQRPQLALPPARPLSRNPINEAVEMRERGEARRTRHFALSCPSVKRKRHESAMNSVIAVE